MHTPVVQEGVGILDHEGVFLVLQVDYERCTADLLSATNTAYGLLTGVSFSQIVAMDQQRYRRAVDLAHGTELAADGPPATGFLPIAGGASGAPRKSEVPGKS